MPWAELHSESEALATEAHLARLAHDYPKATELYRRAAGKEQQALESLDVSKARTRGITGVSAVALWFKGGEYQLAEKLAQALLADNRIPDFAHADLQTLVEAIWAENAKKEAGISMNIKDALDEFQLPFAQDNRRALRLLAPAGSGKTHSLLWRCVQQWESAPKTKPR